MTTSLLDIKFSDLYLGETASWVSSGQVSGTIPVPETCIADLVELRLLCDRTYKETERQEFSLPFKGIRFRVSLLRSLTEDVFVLRRFPESVLDLSKIGIASTYLPLMLKPNLTGLVMVAGSFSQGKTTTASSLVMGRIALHGGIAVCIEDPPEMPMEGPCGKGVVYQCWASQGSFAQECRHAARWSPSIIFVGEVRDAETATETLKASLNGGLVVCTIHSDNVCGAIERIYALANGVAGSGDDIANILANSLRMVIHQRLQGRPRRPELEFLMVDGVEEPGIRNIIKQKRFSGLGDVITMQHNRMFKRSM